MFSGKVALITGGATGIGKCFTDILLEHGVSKMYVMDINKDLGTQTTKEMNKKYGIDTVKFIEADVRNPKVFESAFQQIVKEAKHLDIFCNNAGVIEGKDTLDINFIAAMNGMEYGLKYMGRGECGKGGSGGFIVNTSSILGLTTVTGYPLYAASKHGIIGATKTYGLPFYYEQTGVKIAAICPGVTDTPLASGWKDDNTSIYKQQAIVELSNLPKQRPERVAECLITVLKKGKTGSVWVTENEEPPYEIEFPHYTTLKKKTKCDEDE